MNGDSSMRVRLAKGDQGVDPEGPTMGGVSEKVMGDSAGEAKTTQARVKQKEPQRATSSSSAQPPGGKGGVRKGDGTDMDVDDCIKSGVNGSGVTPPNNSC